MGAVPKARDGGKTDWASVLSLERLIRLEQAQQARDAAKDRDVRDARW
jgi:hypothetical protein